MSTIIDWTDFEKVELRVGTIISIDDFPQAKKPAYRLQIDLGEFGTKSSSAQITELYAKDSLLGKQVLCVVNLLPKRIAGFKSEVLTTGVSSFQGEIVLIHPDRQVPNGSRLI